MNELVCTKQTTKESSPEFTQNKLTHTVLV